MKTNKKATQATAKTTRTSAKAVVKPTVQPRAGHAERTQVLFRLEQTFDDILQQVVQLGGLPELVEAVRAARRKLIQSQVK